MKAIVVTDQAAGTAGMNLVERPLLKAARPADGHVIDFVVESDRAQLSEIVQRIRDGRLSTNIGTIATLDDAVATFNPTRRISGKTIIRVAGKDMGTTKHFNISF